MTFSLDGVQLVATAGGTAHDPEAVELGPEDVPEMLALVAATRPGPFEARTIALGRNLGIPSGRRPGRDGGRADAPVGHTEISAVCTAATHRGLGPGPPAWSARSQRGIRDRDEVPFLHAAGEQRGRDPPLQGPRLNPEPPDDLPGRRGPGRGGR
ncbi:hypothetical protein GCM10020229_03560 [Kitasatospora albolonga]|uniref:hypothetical protein n=1 Tax=Kitasatospora albolonga TaxID=68173 RepID=UPI0031EEB31A